MKTHFYFARDKIGALKNDIFLYTHEPKKFGNQWYSTKGSRAYIHCGFYKKLRPILSKIKPGKCIKIACDFKVVK